MSQKNQIGAEVSQSPSEPRRPYEAPAVRRKIEVRRVTLFTGSSSCITGTC
jgi:hypothetical protein